MKKKKKKKKKLLPYWFLYIAWGICFLTCFTTAFFCVLYGLQFGKEKSAQWISSMLISFFQDVLISQPIKILGIALIIAIIIKKPPEEEEEDEDKKKLEDEEWLHDGPRRGQCDYTCSTPPHPHNFTLKVLGHRYFQLLWLRTKLPLKALQDVQTVTYLLYYSIRVSTSRWEHVSVCIFLNPRNNRLLYAL